MGVTGKIPSMKPSLVKLQKFFKLEAERGYDNRAVMGGLSRMLEPWEAEARQDGLPEELISAVLARLRDYNRLSPTSRQEALQGLWSRIQSESPSSEADPIEVKTTPAEPQPAVEAEQSVESTVDSQVAVKVDKESPEPVSETTKEPPPEKAVPEKSTPAALNAPVTVLPGVGPKHGKTLERLGLETLEDMLYFFPRRYDDYSQLKPINRLEYGEQVTVIGTVQSASNRKVRNGQVNITEGVISDGTGNLRFKEFWLEGQSDPKIEITYDFYGNQKTVVDPRGNPTTTDYDPDTHTFPVRITYPETNGISHTVENEAWDYRFGKVKITKDEIIIVNLSGRGDKDIHTVAAIDGITV